jgi:hypothetical protein
MAGMLDLIPIANRSNASLPTLYDLLVVSKRLPVRHTLDNMFRIPTPVYNSSKRDVYLWALDHLVRNRTFGATANMAVHGYMIDYYWTRVSEKAPRLGNTIPNQDYVIAQRGFFWDLGIWTDQPANDEPGQKNGTDYQTLTDVMIAANDQLQGRFVHVVGFTPWAFKYVNAIHPGVATEWKLAQYLSAYNAFVDADACCIEGFANAAFYQHYPLPRKLAQPAPTSQAALEAAGILKPDGSVVPRMYVSFYVGDYDSASWLYTQIKSKWDDLNRGTVPLGWAIDPELSWRFPVAFDYLLRNMTDRDRLIVGDSGAGYLNPSMLQAPRVPSNLPDATCAWQQHNLPLYNQFDQRFSGFLLQGDSGKMTTKSEAMYQRFSPDGAVDEFGALGTTATHVVNGMPVFMQTDLPPGNGTVAAQRMIVQYNASRSAEPQFYVWRSVLQAPSYYKDIVDALAALRWDDRIQVVDPLTLSQLGRTALTTTPVVDVNFVSDTAPPRVPGGQLFSFNITLRNDGWVALVPTQQLCVNITTAIPSDCAPVPTVSACAALGIGVAPTASATITRTITAPDTAEAYYLIYGTTGAPTAVYPLVVTGA